MRGLLSGAWRLPLIAPWRAWRSGKYLSLYLYRAYNLTTCLIAPSNPYLPLSAMGTSSEASYENHEKEKHEIVAVSTKEVDTAAELGSGDHSPIDPAEALRVRSVSVL